MGIIILTKNLTSKCLNLNAPWTVSFSSPLNSSTLPLSPLLSLRKPTPLSSHTSLVNPSNTLGTVLSEPVLGLDMPPPLLTISVLSSVMEISCAKSSDTSPSPLVSSPNSPNSPALSERKSDALHKRHQNRYRIDQ